MNILVTGGAGYIGSHTCLMLASAGHRPIIVDDFSNSKPEAIKRIQQLAGVEVPFHEGDARDYRFLTAVFGAHKIDAVIHFAGLKAVGESVRKPLEYYEVNLHSVFTVLRCMREAKCHKLVFSSSATVYGKPERLPLDESCHLSAESPYGRTKLYIEEILRDLAKADCENKVPEAEQWRIALLRYFNPAGAHPSGMLGEDPAGIPNNLFPYVSQVAVGKLKELRVFGSDYKTPDGTGVRDYIHVMDLAQGHVAAVENLDKFVGAEAINLGTGIGFSVLDVIRAFERASGVAIPYRLEARRAGDVPVCFADPGKAKKLLNWTATRSLDEMCRDAWNWQSKNPKGYS